MERVRNHRLIDVWYQRMWNTWDKTAIAEICTPDVTFRGSLGTTVRGHAGVAAYMDQIRAAFPDFTNTVEEVISEGDKAFARLAYVGTHKGAILGSASNRETSYVRRRRGVHVQGRANRRCLGARGCPRATHPIEGQQRPAVDVALTRQDVPAA
jgi:ketosteroid isomerase-like protein